ncbi:hypothetical protein CHS0354_002209 [Potamilus streckersoni]|uniref:THD domain-containing protein n=1 Tax=Potamilus streckersoni TaxID=2493646 RepID=A0AAE0RS80_9BIVA|nr:hypothetical protein CHS0354_002209 [Potamilus streckersoni]
MAAPHVLAKQNLYTDTTESSVHCACGCYRKTIRLFILLSVCTCIFCLACCLITIFIMRRPVQCSCMDQTVGLSPENNRHILVQHKQNQMYKVEEKEDVTYVYPVRQKLEKKDVTYVYPVRQKREKKGKPNKPQCECSLPEKKLNKKCKKTCKKEGNRCAVQAAHYVAWNNITFPEYNYMFSTSSVNLTMFREADWVKKDSNPFNFDPISGKFIVKHSGLYIVYSQVLFNDKWPKQAIRLIHETKTGKIAQSLTCYHGIAGISEVYTSCGMMGVFQMTTGDSVLVQSMYSSVRIELNGNHTYFGGVLLTPNHNQS